MNQDDDALKYVNGKPKLLFLSQTLPYPPHGGVQIRTYHTMRNLAKTFDVTALCFYRWKPGRLEPDVETAVKKLGQFGNVRAFPIPQEHSQLRMLVDHACSTLSSRVYTAFAYRSRGFARALREELEERVIDLVHLESLDLSGYLYMLRGRCVVGVHHDVQSVLLRRRAEYQRSSLASKYLRHQARLMEKEERKFCPQVDLNITVSERDQETLRSIAPAGRFEVVPNGVDVDYFTPQMSEEEGIVFVGGTTWYPNKDALAHYRVDLLPEIRKRIPDVSTTWVGRATDREIAENSSAEDGLRLTGYVEDVRPFIASAACYVVPIRVGGGTRIKILDAWAMGKAVVSTPVGCEGLDARHNENILIAEEPTEFARHVRDVLEKPNLRRRLGAEARRTVEAKYSWDAIGDGMNSIYLNLIE